MDYSEKCTILLNTCDAYSDLWPLFFESIIYQWPNCPYRFVINTQKIDFVYKDLPIKVHNHKSRLKRDRWGKRLKDTLYSIDTPYVLTFLDDFIIDEPVLKIDELERAIKKMEENPEIAVVYFFNHPHVGEEDAGFEGYGKLPQKCEYKLTTSVGLWRKECLAQVTRSHESPWEWEVNGSKRAGRYKWVFYAAIPDRTDLEIFHFPFGGVVWRGKWSPTIVNLKAKYGVNIDLGKRQMLDPEDPYSERDIYVLKQHFPKGMITSIFWRTFLDRIIMVTHYIMSLI